MKKITLLFLLLITPLVFSQVIVSPVYDGTFDGTTYSQTFNFPTGAQTWAGFSNNNVSIYPLSYPNGGQVSFKATVAADVEIKFVFEANPYPNVTPSVSTANVTLLAANSANTVYTVAIPANATNTYNSTIMYVITRDVNVTISETKLIQFDTNGTTELTVDFPVYDGTFDGTTYSQTFNFPTGAQAWAGFSNNNLAIYPLSFTSGGKVVFKATVAADAEVYFRFEANAYPNVEPSFNSDKVSLLATNLANTTYEVAIPANATNTYNSTILYVVTKDVAVSLSEIKIHQNATGVSCSNGIQDGDETGVDCGGSCAPCPLATGPTNPPARNVGDVKSIYNGIAVPVAPEYTNEPGVIFDTFGSAVTIASSTLGDGNIVMKYTNHNYSGIQAGTGNLDVNSMTMLHLDVYSPNFTSFKIKLEAVNGSALELEVPFAKTQNSWNSYDIDLSTYTGVDLAHLKWIVPVTNGGVTMYIDNVYFYRPAASTVATLSDLKVDGTTVAGFAPGKINYSVVLPKGTTVIPQITAVTKTNSLAAATINQASALPGDATVVVVSDDASTTKTYTISFSVDTSTPCAGFSTEALEGTFSTGYNYSFVTTGTNVLVTFEILDTDKSGLNPQLYIEPSTFLNMANTSGQTYTYTFAGQTSGAVLNFSLRAAYAGGLVRSKIFNYTVGDACALGTNKFDLASFKAYPNPTKDTWTVTTKNTNISSIQVYDVLGRNVLSLKPNAIEAKIDASSLKTGVYFVKINTLNGSSSLKLVKE